MCISRKRKQYPVQKIPLINVLPVSEREPSQMDIVLAQHKGIALPPRKTVHTVFEIINDVASNFVSNSLANQFEESLKYSAEYQAAKKMMPALGKVPAIRDYRTKYPAFNEHEVQREISQYGFQLSIGQVLYHGGLWPLSASNIAAGSSLVTHKALSTTLSPKVGAVHATYHSPFQIWVITIVGEKVNSFVFNDAGNQRLSHEKELLLAPGVNLCCTASRIVGKFQILDIEAS